MKTISIRGAARRLGVHENTIRNWVDRHIIAAFRLPTGVRRVAHLQCGTRKALVPRTRR